MEVVEGQRRMGAKGLAAAAWVLAPLLAAAPAEAYCQDATGIRSWGFLIAFGVVAALFWYLLQRS